VALLSAIVDVNGTDMEYSYNNNVNDIWLGLLRHSRKKKIKQYQKVSCFVPAPGMLATQ
jgi:hypothetical protein